jgi:hypothetical protein
LETRPLVRGSLDDSRSEIAIVVKRVEGVRVVMNQMSTDEEVMTGWKFATRGFTAVANYLGRKWLLIVVSLPHARARLSGRLTID